MVLALPAHLQHLNCRDTQVHEAPVAQHQRNAKKQPNGCQLQKQHAATVAITVLEIAPVAVAAADDDAEATVPVYVLLDGIWNVEDCHSKMGAATSQDHVPQSQGERKLELCVREQELVREDEGYGAGNPCKNPRCHNQLPHFVLGAALSPAVLHALTFFPHSLHQMRQ